MDNVSVTFVVCRILTQCLQLWRGQPMERHALWLTQKMTMDVLQRNITVKFIHFLETFTAACPQIVLFLNRMH